MGIFDSPGLKSVPNKSTQDTDKLKELIDILNNKSNNNKSNNDNNKL
jgi:hypothetical protein